MIRILYITIGIALLVSCQSKELTDIELDTYVYMPQANQLTRKVIDAGEAYDTIYYGASVNGFKPPSGDIPVTFTVDMQALDAYNEAHDVTYQPLPQAAYSWMEHATIASGRATTEPLALIVDIAQLTPFTQYLFPVTVQSGNLSYPQGNGNSTAYFLYDLIPDIADYTRYENQSWSVVDFSSHSPWEGGPDGNVHSLLNENGDNYWITEFGSSGPHWVVVDMKEEKEVHGVTYMNRKYYPWHPEPQGFPKHITLEVSTDGENWEQVLGVEDIPFPEGEVKDVWVSYFAQTFKTGRYFRFTALEIHSLYSPEFNLSCLSVF